MWSIIAIILAATFEPRASNGEISWHPWIWLNLLCFAVPVLWGIIVNSASQQKNWVRSLTTLYPGAGTFGYACMLYLCRWDGFAQKLNLFNLETGFYLLLLLPFLGQQILHWSTSYKLQAHRHFTLSTFLIFHLRSMMLPFVPFFFYLMIVDVINQFPQQALYIENVGFISLGVALIFLALLVCFFPMALRFLWRTQPLLPGMLRERLTALAKRLHFQCREILVWQTGGMTMNAAIVGLFAKYRYVILSDLLIAHLSIDELEAVFSHELAHAKRHHVAKFFITAFSAIVVFLIFAEFLYPGHEILLSVIGFIYFAACWTLFGYLSRRFELEADLFGTLATKDVDTFIHALEKVGSFSGLARWHGSWRHFSVAQRVNFLHWNQQNPQLGKKLVNQLQRWSRRSILIFASSLLIYGYLLAKKLPTELAYIELKQGNFSACIKQIAPLDSADPHIHDLKALAELGLALQQRSPNDWQKNIIPHGKTLLIQQKYSEANTHFYLALLLNPDSKSAQQLLHAGKFLEAQNTDALRNYLQDEGRELLRDSTVGRHLRSIAGL